MQKSWEECFSRGNHATKAGGRNMFEIFHVEQEVPCVWNNVDW